MRCFSFRLFSWLPSFVYSEFHKQNHSYFLNKGSKCAFLTYFNIRLDSVFVP